MKKLLVSIITPVMLVFALAGCSVPGNTPSTESQTAGKGHINILITDAPSKNVVTSIMVTVSSISVHRAGAEDETTPSATNATSTSTGTATVTTTDVTATPPASTEEDGGQWIDIPISGANPFELLDLQGINELLGSTELESGRYMQTRLEISKIEVGLDNGALHEATLPSGTLKFVRPFDIIAGETTDIKLDFDAQKSVNVTGSGKIMVKPVIKLDITNRASVQLGSVTGIVTDVNMQAATISVLPAGQTQPVVMIITPQTVIVLDGTEAMLADLAALPADSTATASYHQGDMHAIRIEISTPQAASQPTVTPV